MITNFCRSKTKTGFKIQGMKCKETKGIAKVMSR